jgi:carboxypeptidase C (cathepsin A)
LKLITCLCLMVFAFIVAFGHPARALEPDPSPSPAASAKTTPEHIPGAIPDAVTHHTLMLDGKSLAYTARAGTIVLRNDKGQPTCRMFYTAYTLDGADPNTRPITFFYNGGPGSSTIWLRMGSFGPVRVVTSDAQVTPPAPYRYENNPYSLLDATDEVFVDAPATGFSRIIGVGTPKEFFGVDQDVAAFGQFVQSYITNFDRWNSPKFLFGESYGTTRSAALASYLEDKGIDLNGIVLLSTILNFNLDWEINFDPVSIGGGDWGYVLYLPTEAAVAWYHHKVSAPSLPAFLHQVENFAMGEYLDALAKGAQLSAAERDDVVRKLHQYTGLSEQYLRESNLRVPYLRFETELLRGSGQVVGRLDARFATYSLDVVGNEPEWDPADVATSGAFTATFNQYVRQDLHYEPDIPYLTVNYRATRPWDFKHNGVEPTNVAPDLAAAMTENPHLRVFSANGYFDFATPYFATVYTLNHLNLSPTLQRHISYGFYQSGHMVYLHTPALAEFRRDLESWYASVLHR